MITHTKHQIHLPGLDSDTAYLPAYWYIPPRSCSGKAVGADVWATTSLCGSLWNSLCVAVERGLRTVLEDLFGVRMMKVCVLLKDDSLWLWSRRLGFYGAGLSNRHRVQTAAERETNLSPCSFVDVIDWAVTLRNSRSHCMSVKISHWHCIKERRQIVPLGLVWPGASPDFSLSLPSPVISVCSLLLLDCLSYVCCMCLFYVSVCMLVPSKGICSFFIEQHRKCDMGKKWGTLYTSYVTESYRGRGHFTDPNWPRLASQTVNRLSSYNTCCLQNLWVV